MNSQKNRGLWTVWNYNRIYLFRTVCFIFLKKTLLHITHSEKYMRTTKAGGLNGLRPAEKREEFTWMKEGFN